MKPNKTTLVMILAGITALISGIALIKYSLFGLIGILYSIFIMSTEIWWLRGAKIHRTKIKEIKNEF